MFSLCISFAAFCSKFVLVDYYKCSLVNCDMFVYKFAYTDK